MPESKYSKAVKRLQEIIAQIENEEIDVDELSDKVKEAVSLIQMCREKIQKAESEVQKVVEDLDETNEGKEAKEDKEESKDLF